MCQVIAVQSNSDGIRTGEVSPLPGTCLTVHAVALFDEAAAELANPVTIEDPPASELSRVQMERIINLRS